MSLTLRLSPTLELQLMELAGLIRGAGREVTAEEVAWIALSDGVDRLRALVPTSLETSGDGPLQGDQGPG